MTQPSDGDLVEAVRAGDREAFACLVERYAPLVYGVCLNMTAGATDAPSMPHRTGS